MKRTILIVDDDESVRQTLAEVLMLAGYETVEAASGQEAIAVAMNRHIDSFLLDMEMPRMSGVEVCRAIRKLGNYQTTPIIFVTGVEENWGLAEAFDAGADDLKLLHLLLERLHGDVQFDTDPTYATTTAAEAYALKRGVCQDLTHIFLAAARSAGVPARYVSGYFRRTDGVTEQDAGHAWAEAFVPTLGWIAFDDYRLARLIDQARNTGV